MVHKARRLNGAPVMGHPTSSLHLYWNPDDTHDTHDTHLARSGSVAGPIIQFLSPLGTVERVSWVSFKLPTNTWKCRKLNNRRNCMQLNPQTGSDIDRYRKLKRLLKSSSRSRVQNPFKHAATASPFFISRDRLIFTCAARPQPQARARCLLTGAHHDLDSDRRRIPGPGFGPDIGVIGAIKAHDQNPGPVI